LAVLCGGLQAQEALDESGTLRELALNRAAVVREFTGFAGSQENAAALVEGLREGGEVVLADADQQAIRFVSRAGPLGYANVALALSVAQTNLALYGILEPQVSEVAAALGGGEILVSTEPMILPGVLNLRAQGLSWGQVAAELGFTLGDAVSIWAAQDPHARMAIAARWQHRDVEIVDRSIAADRKAAPQRPNRPERALRERKLD
jgi:hypothetical protein